MRNFTIYNILSIAFIISFFASCSIEKRVHQKGFFVKSNNLTANSSKIKKTNDLSLNTSSSKSRDFDRTTNLADDFVIKNSKKSELNIAPIENKSTLAMDNNEIENYVTSTSNSFSKKSNNIYSAPLYKSFINKHVYTFKKGLKINDEKDKNLDNIEFEIFGLASILTALISLILFTIPVGSMAYILGLPLAILAILFGVLSMIRISKDSDKFKGLVFSIAGVLLAVLSIFVLLAS